MSLLNRGIRVSAAIVALGFAVPAGAQESLDHGKTPAQLFASDCAICHKSVNGLSRHAGIFGLDSFLRQHYTASRESAAAISAYIQALDKSTPPAAVKRTKRTAKGSDTKNSDKKPVSAKPGEQKPAEAKGSESKSGEAKPAEAKAEPKTEAKAEPKPETKPAEAKSGESKSGESKSGDAKPADAKRDKSN